MKASLKEFKEFISGGNMIELAVAVILAGFVGTVIKVFTEGVVLNLVAAIVGKPNFNEVARIKLRDGEGKDLVTGLDNPGTYLEFGQVITAIFILIIVGLVLFFVIKAYNKMKNPTDAPAGPSEVDLLTEIRDSLKARG